MARSKKIKQSLPSLWRLTKFSWPHLRQHRVLIVTSLLVLLAEVGLRLLEPWPLKLVFDRIMDTGGGGNASGKKLFPALNALESWKLLVLAAVLLVLVTGLRALASYWSTMGFAKLGNRVLKQVRKQLYRHIQYLSLSFHTKARTGDLVMRVIQDVSRLQDVAVAALLPTIAKVLLVGSMLALIFWMNWKLAVVALLVLPLFYLRTVTLTRQIGEVARKQRQREGAMAATAAESISAIRVVQALSLEGTFANAFSGESEQSLKEDLKGRRLAARLGRSVDVLIAISTAMVLGYGGWLVLQRQITAGDLVVFLAYLKYAYRPVQDFTKYTGRLAKASASGERVLELLERVPDVGDLPGAVPAAAFRGAVRFEGVTFAYEHEQRLLEGIALQVEAGQHVALVGPSGGGKSTLVSLILRLYDPQQGRVMIDGSDVREFTVESLRRQISVVLQDNLLFAASARANIAHGASQASVADVEAAARLANAHDFIMALPQGYDTVIGERGLTLSHGQRQRIAIARAAIRKAPILILDEPATGLDKKNERGVLEGLKRLHQGRTIFLISHDLYHAVSADLILFLDAGQIIERGSHAELMRVNGRYAALYKLHAGSRAVGSEKEIHEVTS